MSLSVGTINGKTNIYLSILASTLQALGKKKK